MICFDKSREIKDGLLDLGYSAQAVKRWAKGRPKSLTLRGKQRELLNIVARMPGASIVRIAEAAHRSAAGTGDSLWRLEQKGLVRIECNSNRAGGDGRTRVWPGEGAQ